MRNNQSGPVDHLLSYFDQLPNDQSKYGNNGCDQQICLELDVTRPKDLENSQEKCNDVCKPCLSFNSEGRRFVFVRDVVAKEQINAILHIGERGRRRDKKRREGEKR